MRVLHLYNIFGAATERAWLDYPLMLAERGWEATFAAEEVAPQAPPHHVVRLRRRVVQPAADVHAQMQVIAADDGGDAPLRDLMDQPWDIVHGHFGPRLLHAAPFLRRGVPVVISLYGYDMSRLTRDRCWIERYRWAAERGATFVVLCEAMRRQLLEWGMSAERVRVVRLGIDPSLWRYEPAQTLPSRFVFAGRLVEKKAPTVFLEALAIAAREHADITADVIGAGPLDARMREAVDRLKLNDRVRLHGAMEREQVVHHIRGATALVLPSVVAADGDSEGTPVVLMEAQASGTPCITTDHAGNPEVLSPQAHEFVVPENDPAALARAMVQMIELSPAARLDLQAAGRQWIEQHYRLGVTVAGYAELYQSVVAEGISVAAR